MNIRILYIDSLRGVASLGVAWFHIYTATSLDIFHPSVSDNGWGDIVGQILNYVALWGRWGVRLFFVISGFVLAFSLQHRKVITGIGSVGKYFIRRSVRLDPAYWSAIVITSICIIFSDRVQSYLHVHASPITSWSQLLTNMFYLNWIFNYGAVFGVSWTLALEIQLYIAFAVLLYLSNVVNKVSKSDNGDATFYILLIASVLSLFWPLGIFVIQTQYFLGYFYMFLSGVLIYNSLNDKRYLLILVGFDIILVFLLLKNHDSSVLATLISHLLVISLQRNKFLREKFENKYLLYLGKLSYCIYMLHIPIGLVGATIAVKWLSPVLNYGRGVHLVAALAGLLITIVASDFLYKTIEKRSIDLSKRIKVQ